MSSQMGFNRRILRITWTEHMNNSEVLEEMQTKMEKKRTLIINIRKRELNFLGHIKRKERLENLTLPGDIDGHRAAEESSCWCAIDLLIESKYYEEFVFWDSKGHFLLYRRAFSSGIVRMQITNNNRQDHDIEKSCYSTWSWLFSFQRLRIIKSFR